MRLHYLWLPVLLMVVTMGFAAEPVRWNLLIVTADDMNADSSGWMGSRQGTTPNLDAFAATAHQFVNHHVSAPICQPSRSALMTGRVPHRSGALGFNPVNPGTPTLVARLKGAGWFTAVIEKHVHMKPDSEFPWDLKLSGSGKNPKLFGQHVAECLKAAADAGRPIFLNANITDPHRPFAHSERGEQKATKKAMNQTADGSRESAVAPFRPAEVVVPSFLEDIPDVRREVAQYFTSVRRFDQSFGQLMTALKEAGQEDKSVVIFLSDHGMSFPFSKATVYRNGTWSPVLLRWPGMGQSQRHEEFVSSVDILPTLLELLHLPTLEGVDGRSWMPLLRGESQADRDFTITHVNTVSSGKSFPQRCVRTKDFSYQFHAWPNGTPHFRVEAMSGISFNAMAKAAESDPKIRQRVDQLTIGTTEQFFDLRSDPDERRNRLSDAELEPELVKLKQRLLEHMERTQDPQLESFRKSFIAKTTN